MRLYTPQESSPTVEDFGEGHLVAGEAEVKLNPAFANTVDKTMPYLVFITPGAEISGLYVTSKTASGFVVREGHAGRSTLSFDYRVVAKPYGVRAPRLQMITVNRARNEI